MISQTIYHRVEPLPRYMVEVPAELDAEVRVTSRFFPECGYQPKVSDPTDFRRFHLRYFLPVRNGIRRKGRKVNRVFVLINGLDEVDWYTHYNQIGRYLARNGAAAILVPTPDHLNRHPKFRYPKEALTAQSSGKPLSFIANSPKTLYDRFEQYISELKLLIDHLRLGKCKDEHADCGFFHSTFDKDVTISVIGYSLGGLAALGLLLLQPQLINTCVLLNSGAGLADLVLPDSMIEKDRWERLVEDVAKEWKPNRWDAVSEIFKVLFLREPRESLKTYFQNDESLARKVMLVVGGADAVVPLNQIAEIEPDAGLHLLKIPGMSHFLGKDQRWGRWIELVLDSVLAFDELSAEADLWTADDIVSALANAVRVYPACLDGEDGEERFVASAMPNVEERVKFEGLIQTARYIFRQDSEVIYRIKQLFLKATPT